MTIWAGPEKVLFARNHYSRGRERNIHLPQRLSQGRISSRSASREKGKETAIRFRLEDGAPDTRKVRCRPLCFMKGRGKRGGHLTLHLCLKGQQIAEIRGENFYLGEGRGGSLGSDAAYSL